MRNVNFDHLLRPNAVARDHCNLIGSARILAEHTETCPESPDLPFYHSFLLDPTPLQRCIISLRREGLACDTKLDLECSLLANSSIVTSFMSLKLCSTVAVVTGRTICRDARVTRFGKAAFSVLSVSRRLVATCRSSVDDLYWENSTCRNIFHSLSFSFLSIFGVENQAISSHQVYHRRTLPDYLQR